MAPMLPADLVARRNALGLSQPELARELGVHPMTISKWERGVHAIPDMVDLALRGLEHVRRPALRERYQRGKEQGR